VRGRSDRAVNIGSTGTTDAPSNVPVAVLGGAGLS